MVTIEQLNPQASDPLRLRSSFTLYSRVAEEQEEERKKTTEMATTTTNGLQIAPTWASLPTPAPTHRRHVSLKTRRSLRLLNHAIEYLADEFLRDSTRPTADNERLQAVQLLMALSREIYAECPEVPTLAERCRRLMPVRWA